jgi:phosphoribosyl-AMP cyclohydrolase
VTAAPGTRHEAASHQFIARWAERLRDEIPGAVAVLLKGSHARGDAGPHSDLDFDVLVEGSPTERYSLWIEPDETGRLRHVSVAVRDLAGWLAEGDEPEPWALGLPVREPMRLMWAANPELRERLDHAGREHPPAEPELEDWLESFGKMRNARHRGDELALRQAAQGLGRYTPTLLRPLNPPVWATSPRSALDLALAFPIAPSAYRPDLLACLGLTGGMATGDLLSAGERLVTSTLALLRDHVGEVAPLLADDIAGYLRDGTLERYIAQMTAESP